MTLEGLNSGAIERLKEQHELLLRIYHADLAKDPTSRETASSRSNLIALRHTMKQLYGEVLASDVTNLDSAAA
jgi:hypothetical protein